MCHAPLGCHTPLNNEEAPPEHRNEKEILIPFSIPPRWIKKLMGPNGEVYYDREQVKP